ncbi:MAG: PEP-CTERM sorting domain-containing protein [Planctomycetota bacterium]
MNARFFVVIGLLTTLTVQVVLADHGHEDLIVGITGDNQLAIHYDEFDHDHHLPPVYGPLLFGWQGNHPGFAHLEEDEPAEDFYTLETGVSVLLEVVALDEGLRIYSPGFGSEPGVGDTMVLGDEYLHAHAEWHIDSTIPGVDPTLYTYGVTFRLLDDGTTGYAPSENYTLTFVPEPGGLALLALGMTALWSQRRVC